MSCKVCRAIAQRFRVFVNQCVHKYLETRKCTQRVFVRLIKRLQELQKLPHKLQAIRTMRAKGRVIASGLGARGGLLAH